VKDRGVVATEPRKKKAEDIPVGRREVDVATPDPAFPRLTGVLDHGGRLRVVDDDEVELVGERLCVLPVVAPKSLLLILRQAARVSLEAVVDRLRHVEELVLPVDDAPFCLKPRLAHERDERVEDLGDAAAEGGGREVEDALSAERLGQRPDLLHQPAAGDCRVVTESLAADVDLLKLHGG
jgi:hypothetical protein